MGLRAHLQAPLQAGPPPDGVERSPLPVRRPARRARELPHSYEGDLGSFGAFSTRLLKPRGYRVAIDLCKHGAARIDALERRRHTHLVSGAAAATPSSPVVDVAAAAAASPASPALEDTLSAAYAIVSYQSPTYGLTYGSATLANHLWFAPGIELSAGGRLGFAARLTTGHCFEGFVAIAVVPHFAVATDQAGRTASWRPSLGVEVGLTSAGFSPLKTVDGSLFTDAKPTGLYAGLAARPLRFRLSNFTASAVGLTSGTMLGHPGRQLRLQIELLQLGFTF